jgi:predicted metal-dependent phosphotriesterase family hydrolase
VPRLTARGIGDAEIRQLLVDNPRRLFEAAPQPS